jgi:hypothetical protein
MAIATPFVRRLTVGVPTASGHEAEREGHLKTVAVPGAPDMVTK